MIYNLAKQLKDAGFPQEFAAFNAFHERDIDCTGMCDNTHFIKIPTLSELIEACGDIEIEIVGNPKKGYEASRVKTFTFQRITGKGFTPEDAVAKLWLALNKK
jgi:hypothetical protein